MSTQAPDDSSEQPQSSPGAGSMFSSSTSGIRRSILFTLAVATGFITIVAATSAAIGETTWWVAPFLWVVGVIIFLFASLIAFGRFQGLISDDQYFWKFNRDK